MKTAPNRALWPLLAVLCLLTALMLWLPRRSTTVTEASPPAETSKRVKFVKEKPKPLPEIDVRRTSGPMTSPPESRTEAFAELKRQKPMLQAQFDEISGAPSYLQETGKFLTGKNPGKSAKEVVKDYVSQFPGLFGHDSSALDSARVTREDVTAHNGMTTLVWQQQHAGIPVYNTVFKANVTQDGEIVTVSDLFLSDPLAAAGAQDAVPHLSGPEAIAKAAEGLGEVVAVAMIQPQGEASGVEQKQPYSAPKLSDTVAQLTWMPVSADQMRLAWDVTTFSLGRNEMYQTIVDAENGGLLYRRSLTADISDASYRVYADAASKQPFDSPMPLSPGHSTPLSTQPPEVPSQLVTTQAVNTTASPEGWIPDGGTTTLGNNVAAHTDTNADNVADLPRPTSATRVFDFPIDFTQSPTTYKDALVTQLFYMNNWIHDRTYELGFTESAGNFQTNNFGRGGFGNDAVQADAQDGSGTNNANFSTPADGSPGRMQMFIWTGPDPDRDSDLDDEIIIHEYGHGVSNRLVGGGVGLSATQPRGMGEGWSDFLALALLSQPGDDINGQHAKGGYSTYQLSGMTTNYYFGIRRYPYGPDMSKSPLTYRDIDPTQASPHTGIPLSPRYGGVSNGSPSQFHAQGEVWCNMLWEVRRNLVLKHGFAVGNELALRLVMDGMKLTPGNPTFIQSRDGIVQADVVNNAGANLPEIWAGFAKRGIGYSASGPANSTTTGVVEAFDVPDALNVTPSGALAVTGAVGGPFTPIQQVFTLTNTGTASLTWTAVASQSWISITSASGTLAPASTTTVTMVINQNATALAAGSHSGAVTFKNLVSGAEIARAVSLTAGGVDSFTEVFDSGGNDTDNQSWTFTPNGSSNFYSVTRTALTAFPTDPTGGTTLSLSDDSFLQVTPAGMNVSLYGTSYSTFYVGSNGYVTFVSGDTSLSSSASTHFAYRRVSALLDDLNPASAGSVSWRQLADRVAVTWQNVPQYGTTNSNNFQIELYVDGRITITCLVNASTLGVIGLSRGLGMPAGFVESDFSAYGSGGGGGGGGGPTSTLALALPASTAEGAGVLVGQGSVTLSEAQASDLVVTLNSLTPGEATVPGSVTVPAGLTSATFDVTVVDDAVVDGAQEALFTASAAGFASTARSMTVTDNEAAGTLGLTIPATTTEGAGTLTGTLTSSVAPGAALTVALASSDTTEITVPVEVVIPAGETSVNFPVTVVNDTLIDGPQTANVTASLAGWTGGSAFIQVADNEATILAVTLPATVNEGGTGTGSVSISGTLTSSLTVALASNNTARATVPATVTIFAGSTSANFTFTGVNNALTDGSASVQVSASAAGFTDGSASTTVLDNDVHHYLVGSVGTSQVLGVPFSVTFTAKDVNDVTITNYTTSANLTAAGNGGAVTITPTTTGAFTAGVRTVSVTASTADTGVVLSVNDGAGHTGTSNAFNVGVGPLHHFGWSTVSSPKSVGSAFSTTVTAQDVANNTVTSFTGTANLSGYALQGIASKIVITEINTNAPDEIEFTNVGTASVDISGWQVYIYDNVSGGTVPLTVFTVPAGTICSSGQVFRLQEAGTAPGTFPLFFYGSNINWNPGTIDIVGVLLRDASNNIVDFVSAAALASSSITSPSTIPTSQWTGPQIAAPTTSSHNYLRIGSVDGNSSADWTTNTATMGTANTGLTVPFGTPTPVSITPTVSGAFTAGVWTGNITVTQQASQMRLRADNGAGITGDSNAFNVDGTLTANTQSVNVPYNTAVPVTLTGQDTANPGAILTYAVVTNPTRGVLSGTAPNLTYTPNAGQSGADSFTFTVSTGGVTSSPATVSLTIAQAPAEIVVEEPVGTNLADGGPAVSFGTLNETQTLVKTFTIRNTGALTLNLGTITKDGAQAAEFTVGALSSTTVISGGTATFSVTFAPTASGARNAAIHIPSNDGDENPFDIALTGTGGIFGLGEIAIETPEWSEISSGGPVLSFGTATLGSGWTRRFTIRNTGTGSLTVSGVTVDGANAADFQFAPVSSTVVAAGGTLSLEVTFIPTATGIRNAALHVLSSDLDEPSFDIAVTGSSQLANPQTIQLVRDVNTTSGNHNPGILVPMDGYLLYTGNTVPTGTEIWRTDGSAAGTFLLNDVFIGTGSGYQSGLTRIGSRAFFSGFGSTSPSTGAELWVTDGTEAGTQLVKNINAGSTSSSPSNLTNVNGTLFFAANDGITGGVAFGTTELWKSDGTEAGTVLVKDINPTAGSGSSSSNYVNVNGTLFFTATDGVNGTELWKSDGTEAGTVMVRDLTAGSGSSTLGNLTAMGSTLFFTNMDTTSGTELWKSDGTSAGTVMVADIFAGTLSSSPASLVVMNGVLYFRATDSANGQELWKSDGSTAGTVMVKDVFAGITGGVTGALSVIGNRIYFAGTDLTNGTELWISDGTAAGTVLVRNIASGTANSSPAGFRLVGGQVYFSATDGVNGVELWKTDGTSAGTVMVHNILPGSGSSLPAVFSDTNGLLIFSATNGISGVELWRSDGTANGTRLLVDQATQTADGSYGMFRNANGTLFFSSASNAHGMELWKSTGSAFAQTSLVKDIQVGQSSSTPVNPVNLGSTLLFAATTTAQGQELWKSDGTTAGTVLVSDIRPGTSSSTPAALTALNSGMILFSANDGTNGTELWKSDGTAAGTALVTNLVTGSGSSSPANLTLFNGKVYFSATTSANGTELFSSDGTAAGTALVADVVSGTGNSSPTSLTVVGSTLYFLATTTANGQELWKTDGTTLGTVLVKDVNGTATSSSITNLTAVGSTLFFSANNGTNGAELWKSDGTTAGTVMVLDIFAGALSSSPANMIHLNGKLIFSANTSASGTEPWISDGTGAGTVLLKEIFSSASSSNPGGMVLLGNTVYFRATSSAEGTELWRTDGTTAGTVLVFDLWSGASSSNPQNITVAGSRVYMTSTTPTTGAELHVLDLTPPQEIAVEQPAGTDLVDGGAQIGFGSVTPGTVVTRTFTVRNMGGLDLNLGTITVDGVASADYSVSAPGSSTLAGGASTTFTVTFTAPATPGSKPAAIHLASNDANENPFDIALDASVYIVSTAEIALEQPAGTNLTDDVALVNYGVTQVGLPVTRTFTLRNTGTENLILSAIVIEGTGALHFTATAPGSSSVAPGGSTTFDVTFRPTTSGTMTPTLRVVSNDTDEATFDIRLHGIASHSVGPLALLRDVNAIPAGNTMGSVVVSGSTAFYTFNSQVWRTNGTEATTQALTFTGTTPANLTMAGGRLFFTASSNLWSSADGLTTASVSTSATTPTQLTALGSTLYFSASASSGASGTELWRSDGTSAGTVQVKEINAGTASSSPTGLTVMGGLLYFAATNGTNGVELWRSDGTDAGTIMVADINAGTNSSNPANLTAIGSTLYFTATNGISGIELWKYDGTTASQVQDINAGTGNSSPAVLTNVGGTLFFRASTTATGTELWKSDGTTGGTVLVRDIFTGTGSSTPANFAVHGGVLYFAAWDGTSGVELWKSDGTQVGTVMVKDIRPGSINSDPARLVSSGGWLYFAASDGVFGTELWRSDGTEAGTVMVEDIAPGSGASFPTLVTAYQGRVLFSANDGVIGGEAWISDGTTAGTFPLRNAVPGNTSGAAANVTRSGSNVFFAANDSVAGTELWKTDGTAAGTSLVKDIFSGSTASSPANLTDLGGTLYFSASDSSNGSELWQSDGTSAGTFMVANINPLAATGSSISQMRVMNGALYFSASASSAQGAELWKSDGTTAGTALVADINPTANAGSAIANVTVVGSKLYFSANDGTNGVEPWVSDGTTAGTTLLLNINSTSAGAASSPALFTQVGSTVFFTANDGVNGVELWKTDGTPSGTVLVKDITAGGTSSTFNAMAAYNGKLYLGVNDGVNGAELWESDGTSSGTILFKDINPGTSSSTPGNFIAFGGQLYFSAADGFGTELWRTDGTAAGTQIAVDINPGNNAGAPTNMLVVGSALYFRATTAAHGTELWFTDGTAAGTRQVMDLAIGTTSSNPGLPVLSGSKLIFTAFLTDLGTEIFGLDLVGEPEIAVFDGVDDTTPERQDNGLAYAYGTLSAPAARSFTLKNTGAHNLYINDIVTSGPQAGSFLVQSKPSPAIAVLPGTSVTFSVLATLEGPVTQNAVVSVLSNDSSEASFEIPVTATVLDTVAPVISAPATYLIGDAGQLSMSMPDLRDIVTFTDNLPGAGSIIQDPPLNGAILSIGQVITVHFSATDASGNPSNTVSTQVRMGIGQPNTGAVAWAQTGGGIGSEGTVSRAVVTPDGGAVIAGAFGSSPFTLGSGAEQVTLTSAGNTDVFLAKFSVDGRLQWVRSGGGAGADSVAALRLLSDGSYVVTGVFSTSASFSGTLVAAGGGSDTFIARYLADGTLSWVRGFGGSGTDLPVTIEELSDGNLALAGVWGTTASTTIPGGVTLNNLGSANTDHYLVKWRKTDGVPLWGRTIGSAASSESPTGLNLVATADGGVVLAGGFLSTTLSFSGEATTLANLGSGGTTGDWYAAKYDSAGFLSWARNLGGGTAADLVSLARGHSSGDILLAGTFASTSAVFGTGGPTTQSFSSLGSSDVALLRISSTTGNLVWAKRLGGPGADLASAMMLLPDQSIALAGTFAGGSMQLGTGEVNATTLTAPTASAKTYLARYQSSDGSLIWAAGSGGTALESVTGIDLLGNDGIGVAGSFGTPSTTFGSTTLTSSGGNDVFLAKYARTDGSPVWAKKGGGANADALHAFATLQNGSAMLIGTFQPPSATFGAGEAAETTLVNADTSGTNTDFFFVRLHGGGVEDAVAPQVSLLPPSGLSTTTLTFNAKVDSRGQNTTVEVDYGPTTAYGTTVALTEVPAGLIPETRSLPLTGLTAASTLHFRLRATNGAGTTTSANQAITTYADAEISVEQPVGTPVADGASSSFGTVALGSSTALTFTVRNDATSGTLTGLALTKDGAAAADFALSSLPVTSLVPGESTTFTVTYTPSAAGTRTAALHLASNDGDENPYDITLTGDNLLPAAFPTAGSIPITASGYTMPAGRSLGLSLGFAPASGTVITVISNTATTPINGTFFDLPQGGIISASFGGQTYLFQANYAGGDGNDLVLTRAFDWSWVKGSSSGNQASTYGTQGIPAAANTPGFRSGAMTWTGADGTLWLFGGSQSGTLYADLWQYFPATNQWVWRKGSNIGGVGSVNGTRGVEDPANAPGARSGGTTWTDSAGRLWLFGGSDSDLWRYNPATNNWARMHGNSNVFNSIYGTQGVPAPSNTPGSRQQSVAWTSADGNLWLFGGFSASLYLNDLWKYDIATGMWTWMKGSTSTNLFGTYGTKGVAAAANTPGTRGGSAAWTDAQGRLWLFGGIGYGTNITAGALGDLWLYDPATNNWTWMSGSGAGPYNNGVYGTQCLPGAANTPGYRQYAKGWTDLQGRLWLFGGFGYGYLGATPGELSDLWYFDTTSNQWAWVKGSQFTQSNGVYGSQGLGANTNSPGARQQHAIFPPNASLRDLWMFGGTGFAATGITNTGLNDVWKLDLPNIPSVSTLAATSITSAGVTLNAGVTPDGLPTSLRFAYGTSANLTGATLTTWQPVGTSTVNGTLNLSLLAPSTTYYYRAEAYNSAGAATGAVLSFTTPAAADISVSDGPTILADGLSTVDFGSVATNSSIPRTLTLANVGTDALTGISFTLDGPDAASFTVGALPATLASGANAAITVTLSTGATAGPLTAALHILSSDPDEPSFDIVLSATNIGLTAYQMWAATQTFPGGNSTVTADPDGDGLTNLQEFAFGLNPNASSNSALVLTGGSLTTRGTPIPRVVPQAFGVNYQAAFCCNMAAMAAGYTYTVQFSGDLFTWFNSSATPTVQASDGNVQAVTVPYPFLLPNRQKARFFKVVVSPPP